jgi:hypothetical protein
MGQSEQRDTVTLYEKYYDAEFEEFLNQAIGDRMTARQVDWGAAKSRHESLLRGMLLDHYFRHDVSKQFRLILCLIAAIVGYGRIAIPSVDLFIKVILVVLTL